VYHLGRYPDVKEQMLQEFNSVFGDDLDRPIEYEDLNKLVYCDAIIKEGILKKKKYVCILYFYNSRFLILSPLKSFSVDVDCSNDIQNVNKGR
jgi:hypothetical protein